jgi:DNA polymerase-3 subunit delta'
VVTADALPLLPWLREALGQTLLGHKGHALLLHGAPGDGSWDLAMALGQAWLCEGQGARPCGRCTACALYASGAHPDQNWLIPQDLALQRGLPVEVKEGRKPSRQIRVDEVRAVIDRLSTTSGRGHGRVLVIFPGEAMNAIAASALLKTLEEPAAGTRIVIAAAEPARLLPTIRSRCQHFRLARAESAQAHLWLSEQGVPHPQVLLAACDGRPLDAQRLHLAGLAAEAWLALPARIAGGDSRALNGLGTAMMLDTLSKLCHDAMASVVGGEPRFFPRESLPADLDLPALSRWQRSLARVLRHPEHPWNEPLLADALVAEARDAMTRRAA